MFGYKGIDIHRLVIFRNRRIWKDFWSSYMIPKGRTFCLIMHYKEAEEN